MANDNGMLIPPPKTDCLKPSPKDVAEELMRLKSQVHAIFCTLECASSGFEKADSCNDMNLWIRAARVVERCVADLESLRDNVDDAAGMEVVHG